MELPKATTPSKISGVIRSTDSVAQTVTLETGRIYHSEAKLDLTKLASGDKVTVTFTEADGKLLTSNVAISPSPEKGNKP